MLKIKKVLVELETDSKESFGLLSNHFSRYINIDFSLIMQRIMKDLEITSLKINRLEINLPETHLNEIKNIENHIEYLIKDELYNIYSNVSNKKIYKRSVYNLIQEYSVSNILPWWYNPELLDDNFFEEKNVNVLFTLTKDYRFFLKIVKLLKSENVFRILKISLPEYEFFKKIYETKKLFFRSFHKLDDDKKVYILYESLVDIKKLRRVNPHLVDVISDEFKINSITNDLLLSNINGYKKKIVNNNRYLAYEKVFSNIQIIENYFKLKIVNEFSYLEKQINQKKIFYDKNSFLNTLSNIIDDNLFVLISNISLSGKYSKKINKFLTMFNSDYINLEENFISFHNQFKLSNLSVKKIKLLSRYNFLKRISSSFSKNLDESDLFSLLINDIIKSEKLNKEFLLKINYEDIEKLSATQTSLLYSLQNPYPYSNISARISDEIKYENIYLNLLHNKQKQFWIERDVIDEVELINFVNVLSKKNDTRKLKSLVFSLEANKLLSSSAVSEDSSYNNFLKSDNLKLKKQNKFNLDYSWFSLSNKKFKVFFKEYLADKREISKKDLLLFIDFILVRNSGYELIFSNFSVEKIIRILKIKFSNETVRSITLIIYDYFLNHNPDQTDSLPLKFIFFLQSKSIINKSHVFNFINSSFTTSLEYNKFKQDLFNQTSNFYNLRSTDFEQIIETNSSKANFESINKEFNTISYFIEFGSFPYDSKRFSLQQLRSTFLKSISVNNTLAKKYLFNWSRSSIKLERLFMIIFEKGLSNRFNEKTTNSLLNIVYPDLSNHLNFAINFFKEYGLLEGDSVDNQINYQENLNKILLFWPKYSYIIRNSPEFIARIFFNNMTNVENNIKLYQRNLKKSSLVSSLRKKVFLEKIIKSIKNQIENKKVEASQHDYKIQDELKDGVLINNSGLILFWPFLKTLFLRLNLLDETSNYLKDNTSKDKAILATDYIVNGLESNEKDFILNKILCGVDSDWNTDTSNKLNDYELGICDSAIQAVITNWKKVNSVQTLRDWYLKREGIISENDDSYVINVSKKPFDVFLKNLKWSFSLINYSILKKKIIINWEY